MKAEQNVTQRLDQLDKIEDDQLKALKQKRNDEVKD